MHMTFDCKRINQFLLSQRYSNCMHWDDGSADSSFEPRCVGILSFETGESCEYAVHGIDISGPFV